MIFWLVEEHTGTYSGIAETISWRQIVGAKIAVNAFIRAEAIHSGVPEHMSDTNLGVWKERTASDKWTFAFLPDELEECVPDYLWMASDGSDIWYEVRKLGKLYVDDIRTGSSTMSVAFRDARE
jgi:hypothetical protein